MDRPTDWEGIIFGVAFGMGCLILATIVLVVVIRQVSENRRAKMLVAREEAYRALAERYDALQADTSSQQARTVAELEGLRERLTAIEGLLRSVDYA